MKKSEVAASTFKLPTIKIIDARKTETARVIEDDDLYVVNGWNLFFLLAGAVSGLLAGCAIAYFLIKLL